MSNVLQTASATFAGIVVSTDHLIDGVRVGSAERFEVRSPVDRSLVGSFASGGPAEVDAAVSAASRAFATWRHTTPAERAAALRRLGAAVRARAEDLIALEVLSVGTAESAVRGLVTGRIPGYFDYYADLLERLGDQTYEGPGDLNQVRYEPAGVAALLVPWNGPLGVSTYKLAPALAAGDTVVLKTPEWAPQSISLLGELVAEAGIPDGVVNIVHGLGPAAGAALVAHPGVARISFTGSTATGRAIGEVASANLVPVSFELGGKSPLVVLPGADLDLATRIILGQYFNAGQVCYSGTRLVVHDTVADELLDRLTTAVASVPVGDPREPSTVVGPLITPQHLDRVRGFVDRAVAAGARVVYGGRTAPAGDQYFLPTLLADVTPDMEVWREEVFGPVSVWTTFSEPDEALAKANDTVYGLGALVVGPEDDAVAFAVGIEAGMVWVNCSMLRSIEQPFGGSGVSGVGREGGRWGFEFFTDVKNLCIVRSG